MKRLLIVLVTLATLTGCSNVEPKPIETKTQAQIEAEFLSIADESCTHAQASDILEKLTNDAPSRVLVLARANAYRDYSAVWIDNKNVAQVIYEYELTVCSPSYLISMQKEANHDNSGDYEHHIKLNADGTYTWTQHVPGEAVGVLESTIFTVDNTYLVAAKFENPANDRTFEYGPITGADLQLLKDAVDAELIRIG